MSDQYAMEAPDAVDLAERAILGSMMMSAAAVHDVADILDGPEFRSPRHETIYDTIVGLAAEGRPHDALAVGLRLDEIGDTSRCGGAAYVHQLVGCVTTPTSAGWYAEQVWEAAMKRRINALGHRLQSVSAQDGPALEVLDAARAELDAATETRERDGGTDGVAEALDALSRPPGLPTPWACMTESLGGFTPGYLIVVAARPAKGKTVLGAECALDMARRGKTALFFSLEMSEAEIYTRLMSNVASVDGKRIINREMRDSDWVKMREAGDYLRSLPLKIDDRPGLGLAQIRSKIRQVQRDHDVGLVVVDYLQHVAPPHGVQDRRVQVDQIAWGLKTAARSLDVPMLALAQLSRGAAGRSADPEGWTNPALSDLRESGGIEASADIVGLYDRKEGDHGADARVFWAKNRHGPQDYNNFVFQGHYSRITEAGEPWNV